MGFRQTLARVMLLAMLAPSMAMAAEPAPPESDAALTEMRGGFVTAGGLTFGLGVEVSTRIDGTLALVSSVSYTGQDATPTPIAPPVAGAQPSAPAKAEAASQGGDLPTAPLAATAVSPDGKTTVTHNLTPGQLTSLVVNAADNRLIQQDVQVNITLPGFAEVQQSQIFSSMGMRIDQDGGVGLVGALAH